MDPLKSLAPGVKRLDPTKSGFVAPEGKKTAQSGRVVTQGWKRPKGKGGKAPLMPSVLVLGTVVNCRWTNSEDSSCTSEK